MARILVVDDDENIVQFLTSFLSKKGYELSSCMNGSTALEMIQNTKPDVVLLDIMMPGIGGIDALKVIKKTDPNIGVIMITGLLDEEIAKRTLELGAYDYIVKPFDLNYLQTVLMVKLADSPHTRPKKPRADLF